MNGGFAVPPSPRFGAVGGESIDQWFRNLRKYEATLVMSPIYQLSDFLTILQGAMAAASEEPKFREELGTIEQCESSSYLRYQKVDNSTFCYQGSRC